MADKCKVAPAATVMVGLVNCAGFSMSFNARVPLLMVVVPVQLLVPLKVRVPPPVLTRPARAAHAPAQRDVMRHTGGIRPAWMVKVVARGNRQPEPPPLEVIVLDQSANAPIRPLSREIVGT